MFTQQKGGCISNLVTGGHALSGTFINHCLIAVAVGIELIGTWYTLEDDWLLVFTESNVTQYEIWQSSGVYSLNSYTVTSKYTLSGNKIIDEEGQSSTISISGNTLKLSNGGETLTFKKYNGTPQQLMDYLNK